VDEGLPIAYSLVERGVPVRSSDGVNVGTVHHVVCAPEQDIFHGIVFNGAAGRRFVAASDVGSLHEHGVELRIDALAAEQLPEPGGGAPSYTEDPAERNWQHWVHRLTGRNDWHRSD
jgi:hypothetical protein